MGAAMAHASANTHNRRKVPTPIHRAAGKTKPYHAREMR